MGVPGRNSGAEGREDILWARVLGRPTRRVGCVRAARFFSSYPAAPVLCHGPESEVSEEPCEGGGLVVGVDTAGIGEDPGVAAAEGDLLEADAGVLDAGDDAVGTDADEGDDGGTPAFDFGFEALAAGAKFVVGQFIGASGGAFDDVGDAKFEVEKEGILKRGEEAWREAAIVKGGPKTVAGAAEVPADGGRVKAGVDTGEQNNEVFRDEIRDALVACGEKLHFGGFPRGGQCPIHNSHVIRSTHWARHAGATNGSAKYCVSRATLLSLNSMMLTV